MLYSVGIATNVSKEDENRSHSPQAETSEVDADDERPAVAASGGRSVEETSNPLLRERSSPTAFAEDSGSDENDKKKRKFHLFDWQTLPSETETQANRDPSTPRESMICKVDEYLLNFKEERPVRAIYRPCPVRSETDVLSLFKGIIFTKSAGKETNRHLKQTARFLDFFVQADDGSKLVGKCWGALHSFFKVSHVSISISRQYLVKRDLMLLRQTQRNSLSC